MGMFANIDNETRKKIYRRDGYRCALCDSPKYIQIHHAIPRSQGGNNTRYNLITLCSECHAGAHGTNLRNEPDYSVDNYELAIIEYLADMYADEFAPWQRSRNPLKMFSKFVEKMTK